MGRRLCRVVSVKKLIAPRRLSAWIIVALCELVALGLIATWATPGHAAAVSFGGRQILVDGRRFIMKGVCYSPTPIGLAGDLPPSGDYFTTTYRSIYDRDLPLMRQMGVNCLRVYGWSSTDDHTEFLDRAYNGGKQPIYVVINRWIDPATDWSSPAAITAIKNKWQSIVLAARGHPAVLGYAIGNELNFANGGNPAFWSAINDIAGTVRTADPYHLITTPLGDGGLITQIQTYDSVMTNLNCWAVQMYRGSNFGTLFASYGAASTKPLLVTEFGLDAFNATTGQEYSNNAALPAIYLDSLWNDILAHTNIVSGGAVFAWSDEWWKSGAASTHEAGGWNSAAFPDGRGDEEWWGIHRISAGDPNMLEPRAAAGVLTGLWFVPPAKPALSMPTFTANGHSQTAVTGTPGYTYAVWSSVDLQSWTPRQTNLPPFTFIDTNAAVLPRQFYRAMHVP